MPNPLPTPPECGHTKLVGPGSGVGVGAGVTVVPGAAYGTPGYFRVSFATGLEDLKEGAARIRLAVDALG